MSYAFGHAAWGVPWWPVFPLFWLALGVLAFVLVRRQFRSGRWGPPAAFRGGTATAEQTLADRFARGEINEEEYLERVAVLRGTRDT